jgi:hypothetical protein
VSSRFVRDLLVVHATSAGLVGVAWFWLAPSLTYLVADGQPLLLDETAYAQVFGGDAAFAGLAVVAGLLCVSVMLVRGYRGVRLAVGLALGGAAGSIAAWWLGVMLGPGRLEQLAGGVEQGEVVSGPEITAYAALLVWPIVALTVLLVVTAFSAPERTGQPPAPA